MLTNSDAIVVIGLFFLITWLVLGIPVNNLGKDVIYAMYA